MATRMTTSTNTENVTNVSCVNTSAGGLPEGFISQGQIATNLTDTSTSGGSTSGDIMGTGVPSIGRRPLISVCSPMGVKLPLSMRAK